MEIKCTSAWHPDGEPRQKAVKWTPHIPPSHRDSLGVFYCQECLAGRKSNNLVTPERFLLDLETKADYAKLMAFKLKRSA